MRYDGNSGDSARNMGLYNPQGNDCVTCTSILGYSNYAGFDPHCSCWDRQWYISPDGRPYDFSTGRFMTPGPFGDQDPFDTANLNPYSYADNDPINNVDSGTGNPSKPPLPGTDQEQNADNGNQQQNDQQAQQDQQERCDRAIDTAKGLGAAAAINALGAVVCAELPPVGAYYGTIAFWEGLGGGALAVYAAAVCSE